MIFLTKMLAVILGFAFPVLLIEAANTDAKNNKSKYTTLSSLCFGILILIIMLFLPNT